MANSYLESIQQARTFVQEHLEDWDAIDKKVLSVVDKAQKISSVPADSGSLKELNNRIQEQIDLRKQLSTTVTQQEAKIKALQAQISKLSNAQNKSAQSADKQRQAELKLDQARKLAFESWKANAQEESKAAEAREKSISKQLTGQMQEYVASIGRTNDGLKQMNAYYRELEKTSKKAFDESTVGQVNKKLEQAEKRLNQVRSESWKEVEANRKAANEEAKTARALGSAYAEASLELQRITKQYQDLAIRKVRNNDLTAEEIKRMDALEKEINQLRPQLVDIDHRVGQFGRSVGSYGKQFDSLSFSMAQITREMPAFAYGAQIGFAALSNNIPMLVDEIVKVKNETAALRKEGKATTSVLKQVGAAILSWQTLLSVAVTLLTLYGDELIDAAGNLVDFRSEAEKAEDAIKELNESIEEYIDNLGDLARAQLDGAKAAQDELLTLRLLNKQLKDTSASQEDRKGALDELRRLYPDYLENMSDEEMYADGLGTAYEELADSILRAARSRAAFDKIVENAGRQLEVESQLLSKRLQMETAQEKLNTAQEKYNALVAEGASFRGDALPLAKSRMDSARESVEELAEEIHYLTGEQQRLELSNIDLESSVNHLGETTSRSAKTTRERVQTLEEMNRTQRYSVAYYEQVISALQKEQSMVARSSKEWQNYQKSIEDAQNAIKIIQDIQEYAREQLTMGPDELEAFNIEVTTRLSTDGIERGMKRISEITGESLEDLYAEMHAWYGKDWESYLEFSEKKLRQKEYETEQIKDLQKEIVEAAIDFGSALFEAEIERINQRIEANKDFYAQILAGEELTEERRAALEAERDLRERQLLEERRKRENQQFLFEQGIALARVAMHTAVAVAEALPNLALATLIGILGGIQAATIIALSVPKFEKGTENAPAGWAIVDEVTPEVHTDRYGNVKSYGSDKGPNLRFLEQGDKIYRSREEYFKKVGPDTLGNTIFDLNMRHQGKPIPQQEANDALLREISALRGENSRVWREVRKLASRPISNNIKVEMPDNRPY